MYNQITIPNIGHMTVQGAVEIFDVEGTVVIETGKGTGHYQNFAFSRSEPLRVNEFSTHHWIILGEKDANC